MPTLCLILASGFWLLTAATVATIVADVELTQHCVRVGTCHEGNPLALTGRKRVYAVQIPVTVGINYAGYYLRKKRGRCWWVPQVALISAHGAGIGFGLRFVW